MLVSFKGILLHATHRLAMYRGLVFCVACGFYAATLVRDLRWQCQCLEKRQPPTLQGRQNLRRLAAGICPQGASWPDEQERRLVRFALGPHAQK